MGIHTETSDAFPATVQADASAEAEALYERVATEFAAPLARLARAHAADASLQQDLLQEIHIALWRSLPAFAGRCSLKTWVYRVAHNAATTHVIRRQRRLVRNLVDLDEVEIANEEPEPGDRVDETRMVARIRELVQRLKPLDRQVFVLYLEGLTVDEIAEVAGLTHTNTGTKLHRIRRLLATKLSTGVIP
jgi:RNA polymerase sigma-70 factor (ECF subfamily)